MSRQEGKDRRELSEKTKRTVHQFCENTSIHGLKYVFEEGSFFLERVAWVLVFISGICFSGYFCWQMYKKWEESPVLTSIETQLYPLRNVSFPAITICNVNKISQKKLKEFPENNPKFKDVPYGKLQWTLRYMTKLDRGFKSENDLKLLNDFYDARNITAAELFAVLETTAPSCSNDIIMDCSWRGRPCKDAYFSFLPTDDGMCCIFNSGKYYDPLTDLESSVHEPLQVSGNGYRMGLSVVIDAKVDDYSVTTGKFDGFKILVHSPEDFPDVADRGFVLGPGTETFVGVKWTTSFNTEEVANEVNPTKRKCLVEGEKKLKFHKHYSQSACFVECAGNIMQEKCQCRPYFFKGDNTTPLCALKAYTCVSDVYENVRSLGYEICDCLPPCTDTLYEPEISYASFPGRGFNLTRTFRRLVDQRNLSDGTDSNAYFKSNVAMLHVYYKEKTGLRYRTDIRFGIEDLISAMGGLLGLGLGISFISAIELLYFIFLRRFLVRRRAVSASSERNSLVQHAKNLSPSSTVTEIKKMWPLTESSTTSSTTLSTLAGPSLNEDPRFVRRGSLNLPTELQARLYKY